MLPGFLAGRSPFCEEQRSPMDLGDHLTTNVLDSSASLCHADFFPQKSMSSRRMYPGPGLPPSKFKLLVWTAGYLLTACITAPDASFCVRSFPAKIDVFPTGHMRIFSFHSSGPRRFLFFVDCLSQRSKSFRMDR